MDCLWDIDQRHEPSCFSCCFFAGEVSRPTLPASLVCSAVSSPYSSPANITSPLRPVTFARESFNPVGSHPTIRAPLRLQERRFICTSDIEPKFWEAEEAGSHLKGLGWGRFTAQNHTGRSLRAYRASKDSAYGSSGECNDVSTPDPPSDLVAFKSRWSISTTQSTESIETLDELSHTDTEASDSHDDEDDGDADDNIVILEAVRVSRDMMALSPTRVNIVRTSRHDLAPRNTQASVRKSCQYGNTRRWGIVFSEEEARIYRF